jgi:MFS family permease
MFPAALSIIRKYWEFTEAEFGLMGSLVYVGLIIGSVLSGIIFMKVSSKKILIFSLILFLIMILILVITKNKILLIISRVVAGFS